jgi:hypothetical protein
VAALPYRKDKAGQIEILRLTSRTTHSLIIPKGWRSGLKGWQAAKVEAFEEAGLVGRIKLSGADAALLIDEPRLVMLIRDFCGVTDYGEMAPDRQPKQTSAKQQSRSAY